MSVLSVLSMQNVISINLIYLVLLELQSVCSPADCNYHRESILKNSADNDYHRHCNLAASHCVQCGACRWYYCLPGYGLASNGCRAYADGSFQASGDACQQECLYNYNAQHDTFCTLPQFIPAYECKPFSSGHVTYNAITKADLSSYAE